MIIERIYAVFFGMILLTAYLIVAFIRKQTVGQKILISLFIVYMTGVTAITLFPIIYEPEIMILNDQTFNFIPFGTISEILLRNSDFKTGFLNIGGNIIMCIPFGVALPFMVKTKKRFYYVIYALALPIAIEFSQFIISISLNSFYRTIDIDDVILNFIGVIIGYGIYRILPLPVKKFFRFGN